MEAYDSVSSAAQSQWAQAASPPPGQADPVQGAQGNPGLGPSGPGVQPGPQPGPRAYVHHPYAQGYVMDPVSGQWFYQVPVQNSPAFAAAGQGVPPMGVPPGMAAGMEAPQEGAQPPGPDYDAVIRSVEQFAEGEASVGDVVKTLYATTAQDDQFWKGALVGAAAAVLLTSGPVKETLGKTFDSLLGKQGKAGEKTAEPPAPEDKKE